MLDKHHTCSRIAFLNGRSRYSSVLCKPVGRTLLAIGFQVLLTALSVAIGFTAIGNVQHQANRASSDSTDDDANSGSTTPMGVKISSGVGIWTMITASIALFFAARLAVKLSLIGNAAIGVTLGLVIWAAFFTTLAYLEVKSVSTLSG